MKKLMTILITAVLTLSAYSTSAQNLQGAACGFYGEYSHIVNGAFDCGEIGKNLTVKQIYEKGWRIVSAFTVPQTCTRNGAVYTCGTGFTIFIEKQK